MSDDRIIPSQEDREGAYGELLPQLQAMVAGPLRVVDVPLQDAVAVVLAAIPRLAPWREHLLALAELVKPGDAETRGYIERLRVFAAAALHADAQAVAATSSAPPRINPRESGKNQRAALLKQADALAAAGYLDAAAVQEVRKGPQNATKEIARDLAALVALFLRHWEEIHDKTPVTREQLNQAMVTAADLLEQVIDPGAAPPATPEAALRAAAFTLLHRAYEENRRGMAFLRYHERDADEIAPSLYTARPRPAGGRQADDAAPPTPREEPVEV